MYTIYIWFWPTLTMSTAADAAHDYGFGQNHIYRVGQSCIYTLYMTVCLVISLPKMPYVHRIYIYIWFWPALQVPCVVAAQYLCWFGWAVMLTTSILDQQDELVLRARVRQRHLCLRVHCV
jgi:hypothetical protein